MKSDKRFYFLLGFMTAILVAMVTITMVGEPLYAVGGGCGWNKLNPCYVKIVK